MFGWFKGKSGQRAPLRHPGPDPDGVARIIPQAVFEGGAGEMLSRLGFGPDDPSNLVLTQDLLNARMDRKREAQAAFVQRVNKDLPMNFKVIPWAMIPWSVWKGPQGDFLFRQHMYPVDAWNTMLLAEDDRTELVLRLPRHPRVVPPGLEEAAGRALGEIIGKVMAAHRETMASMSATGAAEFGGFVDVLDKAKRDIQILANSLAFRQFGEAGYNRHLELFGATLGLNPAGAAAASAA